MHRYRTMHLFAGAGGGLLADILLGHQPVCGVEIDPYCQQVLSARQKDGCLPWFPIFGDVASFDGRPWRGIVDVISGGFPCQDISAAGKGAGITGERSGMWFHMARIVGEVRPEYVFVENSPMLTSRGLGTVLGDLASLGYDARWGVLGAADVGAPHQRDRIWIVAHANGMRELQPQRSEQEQRRRFSDSSCEVADAYGANMEGGGAANDKERRETKNRYAGLVGRAEWWEVEPDVGRVANGVAARVDRLKALGNGQVPAVAALAWEVLSRSK